MGSASATEVAEEDLVARRKICRAVAYAIRFSDEADEQLASLTAHQRAIVLDAVESQLLHQPSVETRNRKHMEPGQPNFVAPWELRVGDLRVYYDAEESPERIVVVVAIGVKVRNRVWIGGRKYEP